jgi:hypothetical protein
MAETEKDMNAEGSAENKENAAEQKEEKESAAAETAKPEVSAPETAAPKAEPPHVEAAAAPVKKAKKPFPWKPVLKVCGVAVLSIGCGFGGGYLAGKQSAQSAITSAQSELQSDMGGMMKGGDSGSSDFSNKQMPNGGGSTASTAHTGAALGLYVQTDSSNQVVIAGFSDNSNAESAGLATGDVITALDSTAISSYDEISTFLADKSAGDSVKVTVTRDGKTVTATITLVEKSGMSSSSQNSSGSSSGSSDNSMPSMGKPDTQSGSTAQSSAAPDSSSSSLQG